MIHPAIPLRVGHPPLFRGVRGWNRFENGGGFVCRPGAGAISRGFLP